MDDASDAIWNRAAMQDDGPDLRSGDEALANLLRVHSLAMSGGLLDAVQRLTPEQVSLGVDGYEYFDLADAAIVVRDLQAVLGREGLSDATLEALEVEADRLYGLAVPMDQIIVDRFEQRLAADPSAFASV